MHSCIGTFKLDHKLNASVERTVFKSFHVQKFVSKHIFLFYFDGSVSKTIKRIGNVFAYRYKRKASVLLLINPPPPSHRPRFNPDFGNFKIGAKSASFGKVVVPPDSNRHQFGITENKSRQKFKHAQIFLPILKIVPKSAYLGVPRTKSALFVVSKSALFGYRICPISAYPE